MTFLLLLPAPAEFSSEGVEGESWVTRVVLLTEADFDPEDGCYTDSSCIQCDEDLAPGDVLGEPFDGQGDPAHLHCLQRAVSHVGIPVSEAEAVRFSSWPADQAQPHWNTAKTL
jgi:hypothetical protein